ncbi:uncharacterized protein C8Q71DRAFT_230128 [Rhodofomes roseus]|uniref:Uncharacterized protein n=1 Tax=Rhodofomes roseus TaxID=34475 RepID=A0ABQ8KWR6_9APHY|nr:uncharacterized protein C8Q71DRAFT_230128 [Rhodofomes roseus]KAH9842979.1 hypothetical protein C8Q71DRAFT_230128 [Rhodofomes roseus]
MQATIPAEQNFSSTLDMGFISCCSAVSACALFISVGAMFSDATVHNTLPLDVHGHDLGYGLSSNGNLLAVVLNIAAAIFHASSGAISALRTYAINGRSLHSPAVILVLSLVATSLDVYKTFTLVAIPVPQPVGCVILWTNSNAVVQSVVWLTGQVCSTVAESLALVVTWRTVYGMERRAHRLRMKLPVTTLLLKDGAMYFGMIIVVLIVNGVLNHIKVRSVLPSFVGPYTLHCVIY